MTHFYFCYSRNWFSQNSWFNSKYCQ